MTTSEATTRLSETWSHRVAFLFLAMLAAMTTGLFSTESAANPTPAPQPTATPIELGAVKFSGSATRLLTGGEKTQVRIAGKFCLDPDFDLDLSVAEVRIEQLLDEQGGAGELVASVPIVLSPIPTDPADPDRARFECFAPACDRTKTPSMRMTIKAADPQNLPECVAPSGEIGTPYSFDLNLSRGVTSSRIPPSYKSGPTGCSGTPLTTRLTTRFTINPGEPEFFSFERTDLAWSCKNNGNPTLVESLKALR